MLELCNKMYFDEKKKRRVYTMFKISGHIFIEYIYKMQRLEVSGAVRPL